MNDGTGTREGQDLAGAPAAARDGTRLLHAWSGGGGGFAYADPRGHDALDLLAQFVRDASEQRAEGP